MVSSVFKTKFGIPGVAILSSAQNGFYPRIAPCRTVAFPLLYPSKEYYPTWQRFYDK